MAVPTGHDDRIIGCGIIQRSPERGEFGIGLIAGRIFPLRNGKPFPRLELRVHEALANQRRDFRKRMRLGLEVAAAKVHNAPRMDMRINKARQDKLTTCILDDRLAADKGAYGGVAADEYQLAVLYGQGFDDAVRPVHRVDAGIFQHQIGRDRPARDRRRQRHQADRQ